MIISEQTGKRPSLLYVGAITSPMVGTTVIGRTLLKSEFSKVFNITILDTSFIREVDEMGSFSIIKVCLAAKYLTQLVVNLLTRNFDAVILNPASKGWAIIKDSIFILIASRLFQRKVILWMHGNDFLDFDQRSWLTQSMISGAFRSASCLVVLGEVLKKSFMRWVPLERMRVIPHGIMPSLDKPVVKNSIQNGILKVLYFSNMIREKGWLITLEAAAEILKTRRDLRFIFCGAWMPKSEEDFARHLVCQWGIQDYVEFMGKTLGEEKKRIFREADIFVFPTYLPQETFGIVNLEAMEAGLPIITTHRAAIPEVVEDGVNGYLVPEQNPSALAERISYLADHPEVRHEMGRCNRQKFHERFTVEKFAQRWIQLINNIVAEDGRDERKG